MDLDDKYMCKLSADASINEITTPNEVITYAKYTAR